MAVPAWSSCEGIKLKRNSGCWEKRNSYSCCTAEGTAYTWHLRLYLQCYYLCDWIELKHYNLHEFWGNTLTLETEERHHVPKIKKPQPGLCFPDRGSRKSKGQRQPRVQCVQEPSLSTRRAVQKLLDDGCGAGEVGWGFGSQAREVRIGKWPGKSMMTLESAW